MTRKELMIRAIAVIDGAGGWFDRSTQQTGMVFNGAVKPAFHALKSSGYIRGNGMGEEYVTTDAGRDFYSAWYSAEGFNRDREIELWREAGALMRAEYEAAR